MATVTAESGETGTGGVDVVDPRAPRFGQAITATLLALGIAFRAPAFVYAVAVVLNVALLSGWRVDVYGALWKHVLIPVVGPPDETEPASPHRFAKLMGATFTLLASVLLVAGIPLAGYAVAGMVAVLAGVAAVFDLCVGCKMYKQVSFFRRLGIV